MAVARWLLAITTVAACATTATTARAQPAMAATYHVEGEGDLSGPDPRVAALDAAFAAAVRQAVDDLITPADEKTHKAELDREVVGRARLWVASFKVTSDTTETDVRKVIVDVKIARDKLVARLGELGIVFGGAPDVPDPVPVIPGKSKTATVLLRVITPRSVVASYGASAALDVSGLVALSAAVRAAGWQLVPAPATGPAARVEEPLLDVDSARALAGSAGADLAVIVGVDAGEPDAVRGTAELAALATARIRIIDRTGAVVGEGIAIAGAHGTGDEVLVAAITAAVVDAFADARPAGAGGPSGPAAPLIADPDEILVTVTARERREAPPWFAVRAIRERLAGLKDARVSIRRLVTREVVLGVRGVDKPDKVAREIRDLERKHPDTSFQTKIVGNAVEVRVSGSP